ncbi:hypothetical protein [Aneurinibacillus tyrosinisolvens]|uniref:hypothetical protein n=1 Tax=Aneurinibacillus tyrosinisolvens TaxID=1443435 RepID=UPI00063F28A1|nr:hypothetical protein [Aneurinibacillus tyrosinisolvens]
MVLPSPRKTIMIRNVLIVAFLFALAAAGYKLYNTSMKISAYTQAEKYMKQNNMVLAEQYFTKAEENRTIDYKEDRIQQALSALDPVRRIRLLKEQAMLARETGDFPLLLQAYAGYQEQKQKSGTLDKKNKEMFNQAIKYYTMENSLAKSFAEAKARFVGQMKENIKSKNYDKEDFLLSYFKIPSQYFGGEKKKTQEMQAQLKKYELTKFSYLSSSRKFAETMNKTELTLKIYKENSIAVPWLLTAVNRFGRSVLEKDLRQNNIADFAEHAKKYEELKEYYPSGSGTLGYIKRTIKSLLAKAKRFATQNSFSKAIDLYEKLKPYQDTSGEIALAQQKWDEQQPVRLLQREFPDKRFTFTTDGKNRWGAKSFVAAISDDSKLYYGSLLSDGFKTVEGALGEGIVPKTLYTQEKISPEGLPVIVVEAQSDNRASLFAGFEVHESDFKQIFAFEADSFYMESPGVMVVNNPAGEGAGQLAYYEPLDGEYKFSGPKYTGSSDPSSPAGGYPTAPAAGIPGSEQGGNNGLQDPNSVQMNPPPSDSGNSSVPSDPNLSDPNNPLPPVDNGGDSVTGGVNP